MTFHRWLTLLKIAVSATLLSRGWLTWQWESPLKRLAPSDFSLTNSLTVFGLILIAGAAIPWLMERNKLTWTRRLLLPMAFLLFLDSLARWVGADHDFGMAIEHALQMITPVALFMATAKGASVRTWELTVGVAAAFTFVGHGFYAAGIHPVPQSYQSMTTAILGTGPEATLLFLKVFGYLDLLFAALLFIPATRFVAILYLIGWGGATACARVVAHFDFSTPGYGLDPWFFETLVRTSHWFLPLLLLLLMKRRGKGAQFSEEAFA